MKVPEAPSEKMSHKSNALAAALSEARKSQAASKKSGQVRSHTQHSKATPSQRSDACSSKRMRLLSPEAHASFYEAKLLNEDVNYSLSPAAKHARKDGSLDPRQTFLGKTFNRKLRMRDTFTKIFPTYGHG